VRLDAPPTGVCAGPPGRSPALPHDRPAGGAHSAGQAPPPPGRVRRGPRPPVAAGRPRPPVFPSPLAPHDPPLGRGHLAARPWRRGSGGAPDAGRALGLRPGRAGGVRPRGGRRLARALPPARRDRHRHPRRARSAHTRGRAPGPPPAAPSARSLGPGAPAARAASRARAGAAPAMVALCTADGLAAVPRRAHRPQPQGRRGPPESTHSRQSYIGLVQGEKQARPRGDVPREEPVRFRSHWWQGGHGGV
jgi:hypothetical protein